jgi:UPF0042 nucleotide-binding protein
MPEPLDIVVITGLSGSGKNAAIRVLEDNSFFCIDNLPVLLIPRFIDLCQGYREGIQRVAFGIDLRGAQFIEGWREVLAETRDAGHHVEVIFLDASDELLLRRFSETRRPHPLQGDGSVQEGIAREREALAGMRNSADRVIDTTHLSVHDLKKVVEELCIQARERRQMSVFLMSFGYKYGVPVEADMVIDVRFLPNPFFVSGLEASSGLAPEVRDFVLGRPETNAFMERMNALLDFTLPNYEREGKSNLTLAFGCTGGRHRSVVLAVETARRLEATPWRIQLRHRDIDR